MPTSRPYWPTARHFTPITPGAGSSAIPRAAPPRSVSGHDELPGRRERGVAARDAGFQQQRGDARLERDRGGHLPGGVERETSARGRPMLPALQPCSTRARPVRLPPRQTSYSASPARRWRRTTPNESSLREQRSRHRVGAPAVAGLFVRSASWQDAGLACSARPLCRGVGRVAGDYRSAPRSTATRFCSIPFATRMPPVKPFRSRV